MKQSPKLNGFEQGRAIGAIRKAKKLRDHLEYEIEGHIELYDSFRLKSGNFDCTIIADRIDSAIDEYCKVCDLLDMLETEWKKNRYAMD